MPAFNSERYVATAIEAVLGQSLGDFELIVVDDGSTDGTLDAVRSYAADPRVRVVQQEKGGVAAARNRGVSVATTPLVAFLDADDLWLVDHLKHMGALMRAAPHAVLAFGGWRYVDARGALMPQAVMPFGADPERARLELPWRNAVIPSAVIARTAPIRHVGGFDTAFQGVEDWDLWIRLLGEGPFVALPQVSALYRAHAESLSENGDEMERERLRLNEKHHGPASGPAAGWPLHRQQAVGHTLFSAGLARLRHRDVVGGLGKIRAALAVWPALVDEDEFHFELACAYQPRGLRGTGQGLVLQETARLVGSLQPLPGGATSRARADFALAWTALVARDRRSARHFALRALRAPGLRRKAAALRLLVRSALSDRVSRRLAAWTSGPVGG
jgi:GT2 family glycosyltransferase